jgi:hypothetical protein
MGMPTHTTLTLTCRRDGKLIARASAGVQDGKPADERIRRSMVKALFAAIDALEAKPALDEDKKGGER